MINCNKNLAHDSDDDDDGGDDYYDHQKNDKDDEYDDDDDDDNYLCDKMVAGVKGLTCKRRDYVKRKSSHIVLVARQIVRNLAWEKIFLYMCKC